MSDIILSILLNIGIFVLLALSLNIINGFTGMFSLGHAAFFGIGAYAAAVYMNHALPDPQSPIFLVHLAAGFALAVLAAGLAGLLVAVPCLRLTGDYLAIATLAFAEIVRIVLDTFKPEIFGGSKGLRIERSLDLPCSVPLVLVCIVAVTFLVRNLKFSATGRAFLAIRENEIAAQVMGINTAKLKIQSFVFGSSLAGLAGGLFAYSRDLIAPSDFGLMNTIMILLMIVLGGLGSITGSIVGAIVLGLIDPAVRFLPEMLEGFTASKFLRTLLEQIKANPQLIYAILLILLIRLRPQGIFGAHELSDLFKRSPSAGSRTDAA